MSRAEAVRILAAAYAKRDRLSVAEAARAAYCAGGPTIAELEQFIAEQRAQDPR
jgi:hypothetical protein